jgi:hypothetical protein
LFAILEKLLFAQWLHHSSKGNKYLGLARGSKFGISPRIGLDYWHFRLLADYNFIFGQRNLISGQSIDLNQNHLSIKLGIFFGGG